MTPSRALLPGALIALELASVTSMEFTAAEYEELLKGALMRMAELKLKLDDAQAGVRRDQEMSLDHIRLMEKQESDLREQYEKRIAELKLELLALTEENEALKKALGTSDSPGKNAKK